MGLFKSPAEKADSYIAAFYEEAFFGFSVPQVQNESHKRQMEWYWVRSRTSVKEACYRLFKEKRIRVDPEILYEYYWLLTARRLGFDPRYVYTGSNPWFTSRTQPGSFAATAALRNTSVNIVPVTLSLSAGDRVVHTKFGLGTVLEVGGSAERSDATIDFDEVGYRRLLLRYAQESITKL